MALLSVGLPLLGVALRAAWPTSTLGTLPTGAAAPGGAPATTLQMAAATLIVPLLVALGAVSIAWPTCWLLRSPRRGTRIGLALLAVPMLMPSYLAYAGFGLGRAPGTWIGEIVNRWPSNANVLFGQSLAVAGLILWCWPLATLVMLGAVRRVEQEHLDQLALTGAGRWASLVQRLAMVRGVVLVAIGVVTLLMLGSAVPLHLAQIPTLAIDLWARLALSPTSTAVWFEAWPLLIAAAAGSAWVTRWACADQPHEARSTRSPDGPRGRLLIPGAAWLLAVALPMWLFAASVEYPRLLVDFWRENARSVIDSVMVAGAVAAVLTLLALAAWYAVEHRGARRVVAVGLGLQMIGLLLPGVLIGSAISGMLNHPALGEAGRWLSDSTGSVVLGHVARFGALGTLAGLWLSRLEAQSLRDARRLAGGEGVRVWLGLAVR
ncbi:MAG: hypothetical protein Q8L55_08310, partial [Phycisphaerales bacterium]|nr:hypothetical protein [Phycisphaerales bacterium]